MMSISRSAGFFSFLAACELLPDAAGAEFLEDLLGLALVFPAVFWGWASLSAFCTLVCADGGLTAWSVLVFASSMRMDWKAFPSASLPGLGVLGAGVLSRIRALSSFVGVAGVLGAAVVSCVAVAKPAGVAAFSIGAGWSLVAALLPVRIPEMNQIDPPRNDKVASSQAIFLALPAAAWGVWILAFCGSRSCRMLIGLLSFGFGLEMRRLSANEMRSELNFIII